MAASDNFNRHLNPSQFRTGVRRVSNFALNAPDHVVERGRNWYPAVHDAVVSQAHTGMSPVQGAGIVAAASPGMDFEKHNIKALDEITEMTGEHWDMIHRSAQEGAANKRWNHENKAGIQAGQVQPRDAGRHPEVRSMLLEVAPGLARASDPNLVKAHRILTGSHPDEVLNRRTAPKTNSFFHNILEPGSSEHVTIDGRQADIINNRLEGWTKGRNISSAALPSGKPTRYEDAEDIMRTATSRLSSIDPRFRGASAPAVQAVTWEEGKRVEMHGTTKAGQPRKVGIRREGQKYSDLQRQANQ